VPSWNLDCVVGPLLLYMSIYRERQICRAGSYSGVIARRLLHSYTFLSVSAEDGSTPVALKHLSLLMHADTAQSTCISGSKFSPFLNLCVYEVMMMLVLGDQADEYYSQ
jgi:hypothetical protein